MRAAAEAEYTEYLRVRLPRLHRVAYLLCGDGHRAEDIVQAVALTLYVKWDRISRVDNIDAYVNRMLLREFLRGQRLAWARVVLTDRTPDRPARPAADVEERDAVLTALARLGPGQRAVLVFRYFCDLPVAEVAAVLGCSEGNVKSQTARGLAALRAMLAPAPVNEGVPGER